MRLQDALFNWLQMKIVVEGRPDDRAAKDTLDFFEEILKEDHRLESLEVRSDGSMYLIRYTAEGNQKTQMYPREAAEQLLADIAANPKYNE